MIWSAAATGEARQVQGMETVLFEHTLQYICNPSTSPLIFCVLLPISFWVVRYRQQAIVGRCKHAVGGKNSNKRQKQVVSILLTQDTSTISPSISYADLGQDLA